MTLLREAIVFAILMENNDGILEKAPSYVVEKLRNVGTLDKPEALLDPDNLQKFKKWQEKWGVKFANKI